VAKLTKTIADARAVLMDRIDNIKDGVTDRIEDTKSVLRAKMTFIRGGIGALK
jgi:hypothetical protein